MARDDKSPLPAGDCCIECNWSICVGDRRTDAHRHWL